MADIKGYYQDQSTNALTGSFVSFPFGCTAGYLRIDNDETVAGKNVVYSFDGVTTQGTIIPGKYLEIQDARVGALYLKNTGGAPAYRLHAITY